MSALTGLLNPDSTQLKINAADFYLFPVYLVSILVSLSLLEASAIPVDLSATLIDLGSDHSFSIANILAIASLGYVGATNEWGADGLSAMQAWIVIATVALIVAPPFVPILETTLAETPAGIFAALLQIGGYATFSYLG